jgi:hypothetical protein
MIGNSKHIVTFQKINGHKMPMDAERANFINITSLDNLLLGIIILAIINIINLVIILG